VTPPALNRGDRFLEAELEHQIERTARGERRDVPHAVAIRALGWIGMRCPGQHADKDHRDDAGHHLSRVPENGLC
jgi:hypothetical protein